MTIAEDRPGGAPRRVRMAPEDRERMIIEQAAQFFARHGFAAQIREIAREIGISQGLIYRYFRSKGELIERVYGHVFLNRWRPEWERGLRDRSKPLGVRLEAFYLSYLDAVDDPDWIRLSMYSGLDGTNLVRRYIETQVEDLLEIIATECRVYRQDDKAPGSNPRGEPDDYEMEMVWHLHSTFIYYLVRKHIFQTRATDDRTLLVRIAVGDFLSGLAADR